MTVQSVTESWSRLGTRLESRDGRTVSLTLTVGYQIVHTPTTTESQIITAAGVPRLGNFYPGTSVPCTSLDKPDRIGPNYSIVVAEFFAERSANQNENPFTSSPLNAPAEIQWTDSQTNEPIDQDIDGNPIVTANGEPIEGVTMDLPDPVLVVTKNFALYNPHLLYQYRRSVNSDVFYSFAPGTGRLVAQSATFVPGDLPYWRVTARIQFRYPVNTTADKSWYARVRHEGFLIRGLSPGNAITHANDDDGNRVVKPVLLKSDGRREEDPSQAQWLEFKRYNALPYNALGLF